MGQRSRESLQAHDGIDRAQHARRGLGAVTYVLLVLAALAIVIGVSASNRTGWDATTLRELSLSPQTVQTLEGLTDKVEIHALFTAKNLKRRELYDLLQLYRGASDRVEVEFIDPVARPGKVKDLGVDLDQAGARRDGVTVLTRGTKKVIVRDTTEEAITNGILEVGSDRKKNVGVLRGYGEADIDSTADTGYRRTMEALQAEYYGVVEVNLAQGVPDEVTVCIAPGPKAPIPTEDLDRLARWIEGGGRLLALLDPGDPSGLGAMLERFGLGLTGDQVLDPQENQGGNPEFVRVREYTKHPIVRGFGKTLPTALPLVGSVKHFEPGDQEFFHDALLISSRYAIAVSPEGKREQAAFDLAAASWKRLPGAPGAPERELRVVLIGDSEFANNAYLALAANRNLFLNAVAWLAEAEGLMTIRRQPLEGQVIVIERSDRGVVYLLIFGPPILVLVAGAVVFVRRRGL